MKFDPKTGKPIIDEEYRKEAAEIALEALKSGELSALMKKRLVRTGAILPKSQKEQKES